VSDYAYTRKLAEIYEHSPFFARGNEDSVRFYVDQALELGGPVLEVGAATGVYTVPLARAGLEVEAVDISPDMLDVIREKLEREPPEVRARVTLHCADMRSFRLDKEFQTVVLPGNVLLAALSLRDQLRVLRNARRHLRDEGRLVLDVFTPDRKLISEERDYASTQFDLPSTGERYLSQRTVIVEPLRQLLRIRFVHERIEPDGSLVGRHVSTIDFRYLFPWELALALNVAGFTVEHYYGDFVSKRTKSQYDGRQVVVAKKAASRDAGGCEGV